MVKSDCPGSAKDKAKVKVLGDHRHRALHMFLDVPIKSEHKDSGSSAKRPAAEGEAAPSVALLQCVLLSLRADGAGQGSMGVFEVAGGTPGPVARGWLTSQQASRVCSSKPEPGCGADASRWVRPLWLPARKKRARKNTQTERAVAVMVDKDQAELAHRVGVALFWVARQGTRPESLRRTYKTKPWVCGAGDLARPAGGGGFCWQWGPLVSDFSEKGRPGALQFQRLRWLRPLQASGACQDYGTFMCHGAAMPQGP